MTAAKRTLAAVTAAGAIAAAVLLQLSKGSATVPAHNSPRPALRGRATVAAPEVLNNTEAGTNSVPGAASEPLGLIGSPSSPQQVRTELPIASGKVSAYRPAEATTRTTDFARDMADAISRGSVVRSEPGTYLTLPNRQATYRVWFPNQQPIERTCAGCWVPMPPDPAWYIVEIPATNERWVWAHKAVRVTSPPPSAYYVMTSTHPERIQPSDIVCRFTWADKTLHWMLVPASSFIPTACEMEPR